SLAIDKMGRVIGRVAGEALRFRHGAHDRRRRRLADVAGARAMAHLALDVGELFVPGCDAEPGRRAKANHMAAHTARLVVAVDVEQRLVRGRVRRRAPLGILVGVTPRTGLGTDVWPRTA